MIKVVLFLLFLVCPAADVSSLLESGIATTPRKQTTATQEVKIVSYNIRFRSGDELKKMISLLQNDPEIGGAAILGLQEVDRRKKRSRHCHTVRVIAEHLGMHYAWAAPPAAEKDDEEETGVAILSVYPLSDVRRIVLPHEGPNGRRRVAIGATVEIDGRKWRVYSAHAETRLAMKKKLEQFKAIMDDLAQLPSDTPAVIMGDLNTWESSADDKTHKLFSDAGWKTPFGGEATFKRKVLFVPIEMKLDWVWLRGLEAGSFGIDRTIELSDHWPLWTTVKTQNR
ncbi:MAG TPA: endonuclease/exonuclease/phosphatase family protein [Pyrinomonadaceae bacterium]|nr:endonuclease/exonuclease/phosphatase family protein [Pyrinomonadaceae bacterium]